MRENTPKWGILLTDKKQWGRLGSAQEIRNKENRVASRKENLLKELASFMMDAGELLNMIEKSAQGYVREVPERLLQNAEYYKLNEKEVLFLRENSDMAGYLIAVVLADFINHIALEHGLNRGELPEHIRKHSKEM